MLKLIGSIKELPVLSLRTGQPVAYLESPIINPNNLFIEGWYVRDSRTNESLILLPKDVREVINQGFIVDDHEVLSTPNELIRLKDTIKLGFDPLGLKVVSEAGKNYGKVNDFAFETASFYIIKIYSSQALIKSLSGGPLSIDRSQIIEITNRRIVIEDPVVKNDEPALAPTN